MKLLQRQVQNVSGQINVRVDQNLDNQVHFGHEIIFIIFL